MKEFRSCAVAVDPEMQDLCQRQQRCTVDEKATIRNRHNRIPHPAIDTKWERKAYNLDGIK